MIQLEPIAENENLLSDVKYDIQDEFKVAEFDPETVKKHHLKLFRSTEEQIAKKRYLISSMFDKKYFKTTLLGVTFLPTFLFIFFYYVIQTLFQKNWVGMCGMFNKTQDECFDNWNYTVTTMHKKEQVAITYLTFFLGFYVGQLISRWWDQVKGLPHIETITNSISGFVQLEFEENEKEKACAAELRKTIVRYCLLSWTMCMTTVSKPLKAKFKTDDDFLRKRLLDARELEALKDNKPNLWMDQWWIPITWAISLVNANHSKNQGCNVKDQKDFIGYINAFHSKLQAIVEYQSNPLPRIHGQAILIAFIAWTILGLFGSQHLILQNNYLWIILAFPGFQVIKVILIYAWIKVAFILRNPFGKSEKKYMYVNLENMLDYQIWKASITLKHMASPIFQRKPGA